MPFTLRLPRPTLFLRGDVEHVGWDHSLYGVISKEDRELGLRFLRFVQIHPFSRDRRQSEIFGLPQRPRKFLLDPVVKLWDPNQVQHLLLLHLG